MPEPIEFVFTPKTWEEITLFILQHNPDTRSPLLTAAAMGYNLAIYLNKKEQ